MESANDSNLSDNDKAKLKSALQKLRSIEDALIQVNTINGNVAKYSAMKQEIQELGWSGICAKYHPDINIDDPAAVPLFDLYKFVYDTMNEYHKGM